MHAMAHQHDVEQHLGLKVEDYDRQIRRLVPHYDELVDEGMALLATLVAPDACVLDLGCGTGRLAATVLERLPSSARVVCLDVEPKMLDEARKRLAAVGPRATFVQGSFFDALPRCDAVVASLSLHHVRGLDAKTDVYRAIFESLPSGAPFLALDATVSDDPELAKLTFARWAQHMITHGIDEAAAYRYFDDWARDEHYFPLREELAALVRAGFARPECFWRKGPLAIYGARR